MDKSLKRELILYLMRADQYGWMMYHVMDVRTISFDANIQMLEFITVYTKRMWPLDVTLHNMKVNI